ncbi:PREDICTED: uncharacterized protein LOC109582422 isoform X1 [Amphimedon queenslandica]|uniref:BEN domain-containing protein n=1 Tax=Amphimedon queenslandica TaxID=400682 RepID=A0AAN0J7E8_AMPQE|nr:PREDICTED: uncharacterized protein LOC109582422 isoform X1 [Amphimedon queenslandica]|eukprot:XP_019852677.1 PREDICTED: uncharacterized protein LOC109582422 isoform X1 [Amphimedon queenslandica]
MDVRSIQSRKGRHYLIEFGIDKDLAVVSEDALVGCASCSHQAGEKAEVYVIDKGDEKDVEQNENELDSYEELGPPSKKQKKETDAECSSKEIKIKKSKKKQQTSPDEDFDVIYPDLPSNVTASEANDDVTITKVVQASKNKCSSRHTSGSHSHGKASTSMPHKAVDPRSVLKDYCSSIDNIKARLDKIEDFLSLYFGYEKDDNNSLPVQLPSVSNPPQSSLASRFMVPSLTDQFLGSPLFNNINPPTLAQQSSGSSVNRTKPGSSLNYIQARPIQQSSLTQSHASPLTQKFTGAYTHNNIQPLTVQQPMVTPQSYIQAPKHPMPLPLSQRPPFHVLGRSLKPNLLLLKEQSVSRCNFAKRLLATLIPEDEWITLNVSGTRGKRQINPRIIDYVKLSTFSMYPLGVGEDMEEAWRVCIKAIDAGARAIAKKKRESMQTMYKGDVRLFTC